MISRKLISLHINHSIMPASRLVLASCALTALVAGNADDWSGVEAVLTSGVSSHAFPSAVALVGDVHGELWSTAAGKYTYDAGSEAVTKDTVFDMASCTKVLSTTTMLAQFVDRGEVALDTPVASAELLGPDFAANGKSGVTVRHCLLHNTGYPPDPTPGMCVRRALAVGNHRQPHPPNTLSFSIPPPPPTSPLFCCRNMFALPIPITQPSLPNCKTRNHATTTNTTITRVLDTALRLPRDACVSQPRRGFHLRRPGVLFPPRPGAGPPHRHLLRLLRPLLYNSHVCRRASVRDAQLHQPGRHAAAVP